jgi:hypothetical protein
MLCGQSARLYRELAKALRLLMVVLAPAKAIYRDSDCLIEGTTPQQARKEGQSRYRAGSRDLRGAEKEERQGRLASGGLKACPEYATLPMDSQRLIRYSLRAGVHSVRHKAAARERRVSPTDEGAHQNESQ